MGGGNSGVWKFDGQKVLLHIEKSCMRSLTLPLLKIIKTTKLIKLTTMMTNESTFAH